MSLKLELIMHHLDYLQAGIELTKQMLLRAQFSDLEAVERLSFNRHRLMGIISKLQSKIEDNIMLLNAHESTHKSYTIAKSWAQEVASIIQKIGEIDSLVLKELERQRLETTQQISTVFKAKQQFKGYNLSSTKR